MFLFNKKLEYLLGKYEKFLSIYKILRNFKNLDFVV